MPKPEVPRKTFVSDNAAGVHPEIWKALRQANKGYALAYGRDSLTQEAANTLREFFNINYEPKLIYYAGDMFCSVFFVLTGTAANTLGLRALVDSYESIIASETSHLYGEEAGAPEYNTGCKILSLPTRHGKIYAQDIEAIVVEARRKEPHASPPRAISITQPTEYGTLYTPQELNEIHRVTQQSGLSLHLDGARLANAAATYKDPERELLIPIRNRVKALSLGATKNGAMGAEAVIFFYKASLEEWRNLERFLYIQKQGMQLASKARYIAAQFKALYEGALWRQNAGHANDMASKLARGIMELKDLRLTHPVETNAVFVAIPDGLLPSLRAEYKLVEWSRIDKKTTEVRLMTSWQTKENEVSKCLEILKRLDKS